jgi:hypothetical protein
VLGWFPAGGVLGWFPAGGVGAGGPADVVSITPKVTTITVNIVNMRIMFATICAYKLIF